MTLFRFILFLILDVLNAKCSVLWFYGVFWRFVGRLLCRRNALKQTSVPSTYSCFSAPTTKLYKPDPRRPAALTEIRKKSRLSVETFTWRRW